MGRFTIDYIVGPTSGNIYGMKRYQDEIHRRMRGFKLNRIEYDPPQGRVFSLLRALSFPLQVFASVKKGAPKHITTQFLAYLLFLPGMENSVVTVYDTIFLDRYGDFSLPARLFIRLNAAALRRAKRIITISDHSASRISGLMHIPMRRICVAKPGLDSKRFRPCKKSAEYRKFGSPVVLALGSEEPRQNMDKILAAISELETEFPGIVLLKAGNPQWRGGRGRLLSIASQLGISSRVIFLGYVPESHLPHLYSSSDVFVYPCSSAGWGLPVAEAMACGTPVVTSDRESLPEVAGGCSLPVNPQDASAIAAAVRKVLRSPELRSALRKCGIRRVKALSWKAAAEQTRRIYESML